MCIVRVFCCGGCSVKSAAIVAAVLNAIATGLFFLIALTLWGQVGNYEKYPSFEMAGADLGVIVGSGFGAFFAGLIALGILLCLIRAIIKEEAVWLLPWLIGDMISIVIQFINVIVTFVMLGIGSVALLPVLGFQIAYVSFDLYLWIVMLNYYGMLKNEPKNLPAYESLQQDAQISPQPYPV